MAEHFKTELIQKNKDYYLFVFSLLNYCKGEKKLTYIIIRKTIEDVQALIKDK